MIFGCTQVDMQGVKLKPTLRYRKNDFTSRKPNGLMKSIQMQTGGPTIDQRSSQDTICMYEQT